MIEDGVVVSFGSDWPVRRKEGRGGGKGEEEENSWIISSTLSKTIENGVMVPFGSDWPLRRREERGGGGGWGGGGGITAVVVLELR